ncbi:MAG: lipoyl synthase [Candidatus Omnitrophota bacterium]
MVNALPEKLASQYALPAWFRQEIPDIPKIKKMQMLLRDRRLSTVCEEARCPNMGQCWGRGVATFMILGEVCTRSCSFCNVTTGKPAIPDPSEPEHVAEMVKNLGLKYAVITSVTRDDLEDEGAEQFARTVRRIKQANPGVAVELLIPDFSGRESLIERVIAAAPEVIGHNIEMAEHLFPFIRPQADYHRSLKVLKMIKKKAPGIMVKSGFMVGLGETDADVEKMMEDIRQAGCDILTIGQYLSPSRGLRHVPVQRFVHPEVFDQYRQHSLRMGFSHVLSGPLVRSSYIAESGYEACRELLERP